MSKKSNTPTLPNLLGYPIFALAWTEANRIVIAGGGGGSQYGLPNFINVFELEGSGKSGQPSQLKSICQSSTKDSIVTKIVHCPARGLYAASLGEGCRIFFFNREGEALEVCTWKTDFSESEPHQIAVRFSPSGDRIATGGDDGKIRIWRLSDSLVAPSQGFVVPTVPLPVLENTCEGHVKPVNDIDFSPNGELLCSSSLDKSCRVYRVATGLCIKKLTFSSSPSTAPVSSDANNLIFKGARFSRDGSILYTAQTSTRGSAFISCWKVGGEFAPLRTVEAHNKPLSSFDISHDGEMLAFGSNDGFIKMFDAKTLKCVAKKNPHKMPVTCLAFSPSAHVIMSGSADYTYSFLVPSSGSLSLVVGLLILVVLAAIAFFFLNQGV